MAAEGEIEREVGTDRARYQFTGEGDRTVKAFIKRVKAGAADEGKSERIAAARQAKADKAAAKASDEDAPKSKPAKGKKAAAPAETSKKATRKRA